MFYKTDKGTKRIPMYWYKFIIYVQLPVTALLQLLNVFVLFMSFQNNEDSVYGLSPGFMILGAVMGLLSYGICISSIFVRRCMAYYKKDAPKKYMTLVFFCLVVNVLDILIMKACINVVDLWGFICLGINILLILFSHHYFKERNFLFVK